jgi:hypothetical protein
MSRLQSSFPILFAGDNAAGCTGPWPARPRPRRGSILRRNHRQPRSIMLTAILGGVKRVARAGSRRLGQGPSATCQRSQRAGTPEDGASTEPVGQRGGDQSHTWTERRPGQRPGAWRAQRAADDGRARAPEGSRAVRRREPLLRARAIHSSPSAGRQPPRALLPARAHGSCFGAIPRIRLASAGNAYTSTHGIR